MEKEINLSTIATRQPVPTAPPNSNRIIKASGSTVVQQPSKEIEISMVQQPAQDSTKEMRFNITNNVSKPPSGPPLRFTPTVKFDDQPQSTQPVTIKPPKTHVEKQPEFQEVRRIDPSKILKPKKEEPILATQHMKDMAFTAFDEMIERKKKEASAALQRMEEKDAINRAAVEEGLEEVKSTIVYMDPEHEDPNYKKEMEARGNVVETQEDEDKFDDELERDILAMEREAGGATAMPNKNIRVMQPQQRVVVQQPQEAPRQNVQIMGGMPVVKQEPVAAVMEEEHVVGTDPVETAYEDQPEVAGVVPVVEETPEEFDPTQFYTKPQQTEQVPNNATVVDQEPEVQKEDNDQHENVLAGDNTVKYIAKNEELTQVKKDISKNDFNLDPEDFKDIEDDGDDVEEEQLSKEEEELIKIGTQNLKNDILNKIVGTARRLDVTTFTVSKKTASLAEVLSRAKKNTETKMTASWPLMNLGRPFIASALSGPEIVAIQSADDANGNFWANMQQLTILYNHDENPYKPSTVEGWMKTIPYNDVDEVFMAIFYATYGNANYLPYDCSEKKCHNMELQLVQDIKGTMVEFDDDKQKEKFDRIMNTPLTPENSIEYETVIVPINDSVAIGFKLPSLYNMIVELRSVNAKFVRKYASVITIMSYIDTIYLIDADTKQFDRIEYKRYPGDAGKTFKSKIATYSRILHTLEPNEFNVLSAYLNNLQGKAEVLRYVIPESKCSKCGATIEKRTASGKALVFTQQQLVTFATTIEE